MKLLVIIPAYNEEDSIAKVVESLREVCPAYDLIVVNDGSRDRTAEICRQNGYPMLDLPINLGLAGALGAGMKYAWRLGYDAAVQFDGDGQHRAEHLPEMLEKIEEGYDIVCGSRFLTKKKPFTARMLGSRLISFAIHVTTGQRITDPTSGLRMYSRRVVRQFATEINHSPEPDTVSFLMRRGARATEVEVAMDERLAGESYLNSFNSIKYMLQMGLSILVVQWFRGHSALPPAEKDEPRKERL